jgi:hypothetical protein
MKCSIQILIYPVDSLSPIQHEHKSQSFPVLLYKKVMVFWLGVEQNNQNQAPYKNETSPLHIGSLQPFTIPVPTTPIYTDLLVYTLVKKRLIESDKVLKTIISTYTEWPKKFYRYKVIMQWISKTHLEVQQNKNHYIWTGLSQNAVAKFICCCTLDACRSCMFLCASWNTCIFFTNEKKCVATVYK